MAVRDGWRTGTGRDRYTGGASRIGGSDGGEDGRGPVFQYFHMDGREPSLPVINSAPPPIRIARVGHGDDVTRLECQLILLARHEVPKNFGGLGFLVNILEKVRSQVRNH